MFDLNYYGTEGQLPDQAAEGLPDFCHKCGKCCKSATTYNSYEKLKELVDQGDPEATDFLSIFKPYPSVEAARAVVPEQVDQVIEIVNSRDDMNIEDLTFYYCEHVTEEGMCGIYDRRPRVCREAPSHGWSAMPPGCGFEGWQFDQREGQKRMIRDLKTNAYILEQMSPDGIHHPIRPETTLEEMRSMIADKIKPWKTFGSEHW